MSSPIDPNATPPSPPPAAKEPQYTGMTCPWCAGKVKCPDFEPPEILKCPFCERRWVMLENKFVPRMMKKKK